MSATPSNDVLATEIAADRRERAEFRDNLEKTLARIEAQTAKTNGRVTRLEAWRMFLLGGFAALSAPWAVTIAKQLSQHHP